MAEERVERRLAAILAADVAGYSRLMGADEVGTLRALQTHRGELIEPVIAEHRGRIVKTTGDGMLVEFASVVDAVSCAVAFQRQGGYTWSTCNNWSVPSERTKTATNPANTAPMLRPRLRGGALVAVGRLAMARE